jgi:hypothetical protein
MMSINIIVDRPLSEPSAMLNLEYAFVKAASGLGGAAVPPSAFEAGRTVNSP